jgi:hypothetical protein
VRERERRVFKGGEKEVCVCACISLSCACNISLSCISNSNILFSSSHSSFSILFPNRCLLVFCFFFLVSTVLLIFFFSLPLLCITFNSCAHIVYLYFLFLSSSHFLIFFFFIFHFFSFNPLYSVKLWKGEKGIFFL